GYPGRRMRGRTLRGRPAGGIVAAIMRALAVSILVAAAGCRDHRPPPPPASVDAGAPASPAARLDELVKDHLDRVLLASPVTATRRGVPASDDRPAALSVGPPPRDVARSRRPRERLQATPEAALDEPHQLDRRLLERDLRLRLFTL